MDKKNSKTPNTKYKSKTEMALELSISLSTFQRRLKEVQIEVPRGLIHPDLQLLIYKKIGLTRNDAK
jgi:hypothetical protein